MHRRVAGHFASNAVAYVALFFALTGGAYAVGSSGGGGGDGGAIRAASDTRAYGRFKDGPVFTQDGTGSLLQLTVPSGQYVILGKATVFQDQVEFECRLTAGAQFDRSRLGNISGAGPETLTMTVLNRANAPFTVRLRCPDNDPSKAYRVTDLKITAIRVTSLSNKAG
jgi:hypothetical protein